MKTLIASLVASGLLIAALPAQETPAPGAKVIHQRKKNQQKRIAQGVKSGQLTAGETGRLENRESNLNKDVKADRAANGGKLTAQERQNVRRRQNKISKSIYNDKHNGATQPGVTPNTPK